jgi:hypothetical protein
MAPDRSVPALPAGGVGRPASQPCNVRHCIVVLIDAYRFSPPDGGDVTRLAFVGLRIPTMALCAGLAVSSSNPNPADPLSASSPEMSHEYRFVHLILHVAINGFYVRVFGSKATQAGLRRTFAVRLPRPVVLWRSLSLPTRGCY